MDGPLAMPMHKAAALKLLPKTPPPHLPPTPPPPAATAGAVADRTRPSSKLKPPSSPPAPPVIMVLPLPLPAPPAVLGRITSFLTSNSQSHPPPRRLASAASPFSPSLIGMDSTRCGGVHGPPRPTA